MAYGDWKFIEEYTRRYDPWPKPLTKVCCCCLPYEECCGKTTAATVIVVIRGNSSE